MTIYEMLKSTALKYPRLPAIDFMGRVIYYTELMQLIEESAEAFRAIGLKKGDTVLVALPNVPQAIICFYALNLIGVKAAMAHPLSTSPEFERFVEMTGTHIIVTMDMFYSKFAKILADETKKIEKLIYCSIPDFLPPLKGIGFKLTRGRKIRKPPKTGKLISWYEFVRAGHALPLRGATAPPREIYSNDTDCAAILFSGGTTAMPKGIELSSKNFNALTLGAGSVIHPQPGYSIAGILPLFHGFGLGICTNACLYYGVKIILIPEFSTKNYINCLLKYKPSYMAGVPTLFEALLRDSRFHKVPFDKLKNAWSGGDKLPITLKERFDLFLKEHGSAVELGEGYGLTETVTACVLTPNTGNKKGSTGLPLPGSKCKIVNVETGETMPAGEEGEICISGEQVMLGYLNDREGTEKVLRKHSDGIDWFHSGDIGSMDEDGFIYFRGRYKRVLKISGMSVHPEQVEQILEEHPKVERACVIGIDDAYQMTSLKAFIVLSKGETLSIEELKAWCKERLIKWSIPRTFEFRDSLPTTKVGKVDYRQMPGIHI
ncbi:MAG: AMP-binding protein [Spirochaetaceae bacterium]|jgi:long-chain acyl-CoA synthetase|nr:AMP-binding protein [Spirochaetaceae bacterium]